MIDLWSDSVPELAKPNIHLLSRKTSLEQISSLPRCMTRDIISEITQYSGAICVDHKELYVIACDDSYAQKYAPEFVLSHAKYNLPVHLHIEAIDIDTFFLMYRLFELVPFNMFSVSYTLDSNVRNLSRENIDVNKNDWQSYFTCMRFLIAEKLLNCNESVVICDTDMIRLSEYQFPDASLALCFDPYYNDNERHSIWACINKIKNDELGRQFLSTYNQILEQSYQDTERYEWGIDQRCLYRTFKTIENDAISIFDNNQSFYDGVIGHVLDSNSPYIMPHRHERWFTDTLWCHESKKYREILYK